MLHDIAGMDEDGESTSLIDEVVQDLADSAEEAIPLIDVLEFAPLPELIGTMAASDGTIHDDISVTFGLFGLPEESDLEGAGSQTLGFVTSAPTSATNVSAGDELVFDVGQLPALEGYETVLLDYVFGQAEPADADVEDGLAPLEVLSARFGADTVEWAGAEIDGQMEVVMWSGVAGNTKSAAAAAVSDAAPQSESTDAATSATERPDAAVVQTANHRPSGSIVQAGAFSDFMGFPVKSAFFGPKGLAITAFCMIAGGAVGGVGGVVVGAVVCGLGGTILAVKDVFTAIDDNTPGANPHPGTPGGSAGEPHLTTFDGARHDHQVVGESDMVMMDGMRVQLRTAPFGSSRRVSVNTAGAMDVGGDVIVVDVLTGSHADIMVNGEAVQLEAGKPLTLPEGGGVNLFGNSVDVAWPDGRAVTLTLYGDSLDATVVLPDDVEGTITGLLGDFDGDPDNDFFTRDGNTFEDLTDETFYQEVAESWRVTEDENLFDTPLTHDRAFPELGKTDPPSNLAWATAICEATGLTESFLDDCILDLTETGDVGYAHRAAANQAIFEPKAFYFFNRAGGGSDTAVSFEDASLTKHAGQTDDAGHALVQLKSEDGDQLHALNLPEADVDWSAPMVVADCGIAVADDDRIVTPFEDDDGFAFQVLDAQSGKVTDTVRSPFSIRDCADMTASGTTAVVASSGKDSGVLGFDTASGEVLYEKPVPGLEAGPIHATDGSIWLITEVDDELTAHELDPATGKLGDSTRIPGSAILRSHSAAATKDGFVVSVQEGDATAMVRVAKGGVVWNTEFPIEFEERDYQAPRVISVSDRTVAGYSSSSSSRIIVLDVENGEPLGTHLEPSSFNNNGGQITHHDGNIIVGTFGGKAWVEAYDEGTLELDWSRDVPGGTEPGDAKLLATLGEQGVMVQASLEGDSGGVIVQFIDP